MDRMLEDMAGIAADDQFTARRRQGRQLATAIAEDISAFFATLSKGGLPPMLTHSLTERFALIWMNLGDDGLDDLFESWEDEDDTDVAHHGPR